MCEYFHCLFVVLLLITGSRTDQDHVEDALNISLTAAIPEFEEVNSTLYRGRERITVYNARFPVNVTHIVISDPHNTVYVYWGRNSSKEIFLKTRDHFEGYQSRSFFYKIRKSDHNNLWKIKNVTSSISSKKVQRIVNRQNEHPEENQNSFQDQKFRMKVLPNGSSRLIIADSEDEHNIQIFKAEFEDGEAFKDFIFVDSSENTLMFCGLYNDTEGRLLMTEYNGMSPGKVVYSFHSLLDDVLCIHPKSNFPDTWLSSILEHPLADVYRAESSRGVIIASQFIEPLILEDARMLDVKHLHTVISYNHGLTWKTLKLQNDCRPSSEQPDLYLDHSFSRLHFDQRHLGILEHTVTAGIIIATGHLTYPDNPREPYPGVFTSHDGGINWKKVFHDRLIVSVIHPKWEVLLAVQNCMRSTTKRIYLSNDLGYSWISHDIFEEEVCVQDVVRGEEQDSYLFVILSTRPNHIGWIVTVVDFEALILPSRPCKDSYVELWPPKETQHFCVKGDKILTYRRKAKKLCSISSFDLWQSKINHTCSCSSHDFVCREGRKTCPQLTPATLLNYVAKYKSSSKANSKENVTGNANTDIYRKLPFILGYRKKLRNSCLITKSLYQPTTPQTCENDFAQEFYFSTSSEETTVLYKNLALIFFAVYISYKLIY